MRNSLTRLRPLNTSFRWCEYRADVPERLRFRSGGNKTVAWSNAFRQSSHAQTLVKIIVCGDGLILRVGDLPALHPAGKCQPQRGTD